jgi:hypothetical protein
MTSKENEFILEVLDRDKDARNYYSNEDSSAPEDIERKQIFHYSCGKKHKIKLEDTDSFPIKVSVNKEIVELYDTSLSNFSFILLNSSSVRGSCSASSSCLVRLRG